MKKTRRHIVILLLSIITADNLLAQQIGLATNGAELINLGTINGEVSIGVSKKWSISLSGAYNPFTFNEDTEEQFQNKQLAVALGTRYWPWHLFSGWFLGSSMEYRAYNNGGILRETSEEGSLLGMGFGGGYSIMLTKNFNLELGAGFLFGGKEYTIYKCPRCGRIIEEGKKLFFSPDNLLLQFVIIF